MTKPKPKSQLKKVAEFENSEGRTMAEFDGDIFIDIQPSHLSYGCVSAGFVYKLQVSVANKGSRPQILKVSVTPDEGEKNRIKANFVPMKIAPGVKQNFSLDLYAEESASTSFTLIVEQSVNRKQVMVPVKALVVPIDVFRHVVKSLTLQKRPIYRNGVTVVGALGSTDDSRSVVTSGGASVLSEAIMDDADMEEIMDLPLVDGLYYDSHSQTIKFDEKLAAVVVDGEITLEESKEKTAQVRNKQLDDLEDRGFHAERSVLATKTRISNGRSSPSLGEPSLEQMSSVLQGGSVMGTGED